MQLPVKTINKHKAADKSVRLIILVRIIHAITRQIRDTGILPDKGARNASYVAPQVHIIINVALHREYSPGNVFIFPKGGRISIMSKTNTGSNSNE
jgi:hypothetical protein